MIYIDIIDTLTKKKKDFNDLVKILLFVYFSMLLVMYLGHVKPVNYEE